MPLKMKVDKATYDGLSEGLKTEYKVDPSNAESYILNVEGYEDPGELRRAKDRVAIEAREAKEQARKEKERADALELNGNKEKGDIVALEKSWREKEEAAVAAEQAKVKKRDSVISKIMVDAKAQEIANRISIVPSAMFHLIQKRLSVDTDADEPITRVLGPDGKPSALSLAELEKEFVDNKEFAGIMKASNASGGGASGNHNGGGATKKPAEMTGPERTELFKKDPEKFYKLFPQAVQT